MSMKLTSSDGRARPSSHAQSPPIQAASIKDGSAINSATDTERTSDEKHSIFTKTEKWIIVSLIALAGLYSPLTANIYFPAIPALSRDFNKSVELINLTVTMYVVMQGVAPMFWGPLADRYGRRPCYLGCLTVLTLSNVGLALVHTNAYWLLMVLRCLQAGGSASTIALGAGVIGDISTREERGGFFGMFTLGPMVGPVIGPVIGGAISDALGWRALFWFLTIASAVCLLVMLLLQPETLRSIVGNGSIAPPKYNRPWLSVIPKQKPTKRPDSDAKNASPGNPFRLFLNVDIVILLVINAFTNSVMYGVITTLSTTFESIYPFLTETTIGLCFLAYGGGMIAGSAFTGKVLDREYKSFARKAERDGDNTLRRTDTGREAIHLEKVGAVLPFQCRLDSFYIPFGQARLRLVPPCAAVFGGCVCGYGWILQRELSIAGPLIIHFVIGYMSMAMMNSSSTLMIDLFPTQASSITACNNLVRCTMAAVVIAVIQPIINKIGLGWTFFILGILMILTIPLIYLEIVLGPRYRRLRFRKSRANSALEEVTEEGKKAKAP
uniref:Quinidine resistance protein-like protein n=1 Tax=Coprinellus disseminatus TaxID=71703 RepID=Q1WMR1_COPDI|nr:quinidine resistance protein-like protein [Coprinellus disseminatus]